MAQAPSACAFRTTLPERGGSCRYNAGMIRPFLCLLLSLSICAPASAWGPLGHRLVARLAEDELTPQARAQIALLLAGEQHPTLAGVANWADDLRASDPDLGRRSARWHYVNLGEHGCRYQRERDCPGGDCVVEAIRAQAALLANRSRPLEERRRALKFVVHFVGDVHQPLHAGYAHDKGGNDFQTHYRGKGGNLHRVWDSGLLGSAGLDEDAWLRHLRAQPRPAREPAAAVPPSARWASQSCAIVTAPGFYPPQARLQDDYYAHYRPLAERQIRIAGRRLAQLLNTALDGA